MVSYEECGRPGSSNELCRRCFGCNRLRPLACLPGRPPGSAHFQSTSRCAANVLLGTHFECMCNRT